MIKSNSTLINFDKSLRNVLLFRSVNHSLVKIFFCMFWHFACFVGGFILLWIVEKQVITFTTSRLKDIIRNSREHEPNGSWTMCFFSSVRITQVLSRTPQFVLLFCLLVFKVVNFRLEQKIENVYFFLLNPARTSNPWIFSVMTCRPIEPERCSHPPKKQKVF